MVRPLRREVDEIFGWLKSQITPEDKQWLDKEWPGIWKEKTIEEVEKELKKHDMFYLILAVEGILDAKRGKKADYNRPAGGLATKDLVKIAQMLKIEVPKKHNGILLINLIVKKIKES